MGMRAAMKKAVTLLMEVSATLAPVRFRHSPVRSCGGGTWTRRKNVKETRKLSPAHTSGQTTHGVGRGTCLLGVLGRRRGRQTHPLPSKDPGVRRCGMHKPRP